MNDKKEYEEIIARLGEHPHIRVRFPGETLWAHSIDPNKRALLDNHPLEPGYHWHDIVEIDDQGNIKKVLYRAYPTRLGFQYTAGADKEKDIEVRKKLFQGLLHFENRKSLSFMWPGLGYVLVMEDLPTQEVVDAMVASSPALIEVVKIQHSNKRGLETERLYCSAPVEDYE